MHSHTERVIPRVTVGVGGAREDGSVRSGVSVVPENKDVSHNFAAMLCGVVGLESQLCPHRHHPIFIRWWQVQVH